MKLEKVEKHWFIDLLMSCMLCWQL